MSLNRSILQFLNPYFQIEIWFGIFSRDVICGGIRQSKQQVVNRTVRHIKRYDEANAALRAGYALTRARSSDGPT